MNSDRTDEDAFQLLCSTNPAQERDTPELISLLHAVTSPQVEVTPRRSSSRRTGVVIAGIVSLCAVGAASPAIADGVQFMVRTGWFGSSPNPPGIGGTPAPNENTEADGSEWMDSRGADYIDYATSLFPAYITLPAGYDQTSFARAVAEYTRPPGGLLQQTGIESSFETFARCAWEHEGLTAASTEDDTRTAAAAEVLTQSAHWPATVATDGGGIVDGLAAMADAATDGEWTLVATEYSINCPAVPVGFPE